ncbi:MAG TPA: hypothetical protein VK892_15575 [Pyrinomonadaceae bacterium]|nr:hypothetical protein [Pyrinomonadaceae bacterium]
MRHIFLLLTISIFSVSLFAQTETLTNKDVVLMTQAGLSSELIIRKVKDSAGNYDVSTQALIDLKKAGVADQVIALMMEKAEEKRNAPPQKQEIFSDSQTTVSINLPGAVDKISTERIVLSPKESLKNAKTVAIEKSTLNPSRQALEKALFKRADWRKYNLNIVRLKDDADLFIEIGRIPFTWLSHRYVFRIYDRKSGTVITAGETTSWGSLAENLAREITQKLNQVSGN